MSRSNPEEKRFPMEDTGTTGTSNSPAAENLSSRFAKLVSHRRRELNLTLDDLQAAGGPSDVTTSKIERSEIQRPSKTTFEKLDTALQWTKGSSAQAFLGEDPVALEHLPVTSQSAKRLFALSDIIRKYNEFAESCSDPSLRTALQTLNEELEQAVDTLSRQSLIDLLNQRTAALEPMAEFLLDDYLRAAKKSATPHAAAELQHLESLVAQNRSHLR